MKNKNLLQQRRELIIQLLDVVNSQQEFVYLQSELAALSFPYRDERREKI